MRILALDTTTPTATAGIWTDGVMTGLYTIQTTTHSTTLLPMIESLLASFSLQIKDMDALAVSVGPGSFTGVRIGVSTLKGLAFSAKIPCIGVSSLEALAWNLTGCKGIICPVINARRNQVYTAIFQAYGSSSPKRLTDDTISPVVDLPDRLAEYDQPVYAVGDGYTMLQEILPAGMFHPTPELLRYPNAYSVACAAAVLYENTHDKSIFTEAALSPLYLRKPQAEREREERIASLQEHL